MNKRIIATLVAASFAGLMLTSPSFATDAQKAQSTSGSSTSAQAAASGAGPRESYQTGSTTPRKRGSPEDLAAAEREAAASDRSNDSGTRNKSASDGAASSQKAEAAAKAEYKAAIEKCEAQPTEQRSACVQDAEAAQTLAMQQSRDGTSSSAEPQESHRTGTSKPAKPDASDKRATEHAQDKVVASAKAKTDAKTDAETDYKAAVERCDSLPIEQRSPCVQDAEKAQTLAREQSQDGTPASRASKSPIPGPQSAK